MAARAFRFTIPWLLPTRHSTSRAPFLFGGKVCVFVVAIHTVAAVRHLCTFIVRHCCVHFVHGLRTVCIRSIPDREGDSNRTIPDPSYFTIDQLFPGTAGIPLYIISLNIFERRTRQPLYVYYFSHFATLYHCAYVFVVVGGLFAFVLWWTFCIWY